MHNYRYFPLNDPDEIRVFVLEPSKDRIDPLRGTMKKMRLSAHDFVPINSNRKFIIIIQLNIKKLSLTTSSN